MHSEHQLGSLPVLPPGRLAAHVWSGWSPDFKGEKYVVFYLPSGQGKLLEVKADKSSVLQYWQK